MILLHRQGIQTISEKSSRSAWKKLLVMEGRFDKRRKFLLPDKKNHWVPMKVYERSVGRTRGKNRRKRARQESREKDFTSIKKPTPKQGRGGGGEKKGKVHRYLQKKNSLEKTTPVLLRRTDF